jgi:hypothetical protein
MAEIKDLEICNYFPIENENLLSVGWLSSESDYEKGEVSKDFFDRLCELSHNPWQPIVSLGMHFCELCQFNPPAFRNNIFIPYNGAIYVAPEAIVHYVAVHWYKPPAIFIEAVLACPEMRSMEYKKAILQNGSRGLVQSIKA